jgi:hypothetical protein
MRVYGFIVAADARLWWQIPDERYGHGYDGVPADWIDSLLGGAIHLLRPFRIKMLGVRFYRDKGPKFELELPKFTSGYARAIMDWGDSQDTVSLTFMGSYGFPPGTVFPFRWSTGRPLHPTWMRDFDMPLPPSEKRGEVEGVGFTVDLTQSPDVRRLIRPGGPSGQPQFDTGYYAVVCSLGNEYTGRVPFYPSIQFSISNVPEDRREKTVVVTAPVDPGQTSLGETLDVELGELRGHRACLKTSPHRMAH